MQYQPLSLTCECGLAPLQFVQLGLTPEHQLVILWWCDACQRNICVLRDLADCWRECPKAEDLKEVAELSAAQMSENDSDFLRSLGASFPEGPE
jgi:hypothetical protein